MENKLDEYVNVSLRIRPVLSQDSTTSSCLHVISKQPPVLLVLDRPQSYQFDNIFTEDVNQATVYNETVKPLVECVKQGYSCTVFAYGQTGTGKTYTMGTSTQIATEEDVGLIPRALNQLFAFCDDDIEVDISVSFIEIYNEKVFDLLQNDNKPPPLVVKGFKVQGFCQEKVYDHQDAKRLLERGNRNRHTAETKQNSNSSRSHAIFTIYTNVRYKDHETTAKLNLVDLAGCESVKKTGNQGSTFQEGVNINKGLLCIGQVMTALSTNSNFIPYRQSIITTILQDSLNKKNYVSLIACINSNPEDCNETIQTLEFAHRVKKMKNKPEVNELLMNYKKENPNLFQYMKISNTPFKRPIAPYQTPCPPKKIKKLPFKAKDPSLSENSSTIDSPKSLLSMSLSSISSQVDVTQQTLSPVIKKYMSAMESSLMDRLETVIKNTLKRPTRSSLLMKETRQENKENTPSMSWNKIQNEVSKLVRNEIAQLTGVATRAASSPIDDHHNLSNIRRILNYDCVASNEKEENGEHYANNKDSPDVISDFKVPELPVTKKKNLKTKRTPSISPIEYNLSRPRRSVRLSLRQIENNNSLEESDVSLETSGIQRKKFKQNKRYFFEGNETISSDDNESQYVKRRRTLKLNEKSVNVQDSDTTSNKLINSQNTRRSIRLAKKKVDLQDAENSQTKMNRDSLEESYIASETSYTDINDKKHNRRYPHEKDESSPNNNNDNNDNVESKHKYKNVCKRKSIRLKQKNKYLQRNLISPPVKKGKMKNTVVDNKGTILTVKDTPIGRRLLKNDTVKDSPATSHTKHVLDLLNNGNLKQLEKLHSIGPKTAQQILLFRKINGQLVKISDLSQIPGWHGKKFTKFSEENFLKKELI